MNSSLTLRHLLWRMKNVNNASEVVTAGSASSNLPDHRLTFGEMVDRVEGLAAGLRTLGVERGSTVTALAWNTHEYLESMLAAPGIGATLDTLNVRLEPKFLEESVVARSSAAIIIDAELLGPSELAQAVTPVIERQAARGIPVICIGTPPSDLTFEVVPFESLLTLGTEDIVDSAVLEEDWPAFLLHTGGTTGAPKKYEVTHRQAMLHALVHTGVDAMGISRKDRALSLPQFFHALGWNLPITALLAGATLVLPGREMSGRHLASLIKREGVTFALGVPTIWHDIIATVSDDPSLRPTTLREVFAGGSQVPRSMIDGVNTHLDARVATSWGMTENVGPTTVERVDPGSKVGKPVPLTEFRLTETDMPGWEGQPNSGRLEMRGPLIIAPTDDNGWFGTGDIAEFDVDGNILLKDREKDVIKSGGEWIPSAVLEQKLCEHADIIAAAVVPVPHDRWGERPAAFVVAKNVSTPPSVDELLDFLSGTLPRWWLPESIQVTTELPMTRVGKVDKLTLRTIAVTAVHSPEPV